MSVTTVTEQLTAAVLALPLADRATLLAILEDSLVEDENATEAEEAWDAEIKRRIESTDRGDVTLLSHEEVQQRLGPKYGKKTN
jgi:putative addiction module component (TIGR02574 family)